MSSPWEVHPYSDKTLRDLLARHSLVPRGDLDSKLHCIYFDGYFAHLAAKTIVVEQGYVDRDFLEDFAAYYVRCFEPYERFCTRLHFFDRRFSSDEFQHLLEGKSSAAEVKALCQSYLGFVVVKRLPRTIIGRTCLRTYLPEGRRHYPIIRNYEVSLYGLRLVVRSLAFQEQDRVAAACATSALWSTFHGTGILFHHHIPSPVEITTSASSAAFPGLRYLPSKGLNLMQMASAIRGVGLEPTHVRAGSLDIVRDTVYAYVKGGIPVMLIGALEEHPAPAKVEPAEYHAIVATGFSLGGAGVATRTPGATVAEVHLARNRLGGWGDDSGRTLRRDGTGRGGCLHPPVLYQTCSLAGAWASQEQGKPRRTRFVIRVDRMSGQTFQEA